MTSERAKIITSSVLRALLIVIAVQMVVGHAKSQIPGGVVLELFDAGSDFALINNGDIYRTNAMGEDGWFYVENVFESSGADYGELASITWFSAGRVIAVTPEGDIYQTMNWTSLSFIDTQRSLFEARSNASGLTPPRWL
jgi:hypothetical protein